MTQTSNPTAVSRSTPGFEISYDGSNYLSCGNVSEDQENAVNGSKAIRHLAIINEGLFQK